MNKKHLNRLANASSPYLQQHAENPVDWYEWGPEALQKAKKENKPLLISIGYSACHWCHVMADESYMNEEVAALMNAHFVCIKVDREERPDIDQVYIEAAQLLNGQAGWPLNAFALPDGRPFWIGVYFPKKTWVEVLAQIKKAYQTKYETVLQQAEALTKGVRKEQLIDTVKNREEICSQEEYTDLYAGLAPKIDREKGGFHGTQKFPMPVTWEFVLQYYGLTKEEQALNDLNKTLTAMANGGVFDQLGGGFARYAVDEDWFAPHFEKMLYDNAQLVSLYSKAYRCLKKPLYKVVVQETIAFVNRELHHPDGGFYASLNADSEGGEGKFYVWKTDDVKEALNDHEFRVFTATYPISDQGNWENGQNILHRAKNVPEVARQYNLRETSVRDCLKSAKTKLMQIRDKREHPSCDHKILTGWNALMITGLIEAYKSFDNKDYLAAARQNAKFILTDLRGEDGVLYRNFKDGKASVPGFLEDYASLAEAFVKLYEVTFDKSWLDRADDLVKRALTHFYDRSSGLFFYTSNQSESLIARKFDLLDNVMPSSNATMAQVLYDLGHYFDRPDYLKMSRVMLDKISDKLPRALSYFGKWAQLLGYFTHPPYEVAVMGQSAESKRGELQKEYRPNWLFLGGTTENLPLLENKLVSNKTLIYVCQNKTCQQPVETVKAALEQVKF